jgi:hypothetical protein
MKLETKDWVVAALAAVFLPWPAGLAAMAVWAVVRCAF